MKSKKIMIVTTALTNDGAERVLSQLSNEWVRMGHKVKIVTSGKSARNQSYNISDKIEVISIYQPRRNRLTWYFKQISAMIRIMKRDKDFVVLSFLSQSMYMLAVCSFFTKNKIIFSERNDPTKWPEGKLKQKARDIAFCLADQCVYQTAEAKSFFPKKAQKHGVVISNPCNADLPELYRGQRRKVIITACRLHHQKNLPMLLRAFQKLSAEFPEYQLEICGQGEDKQMLTELTNELGISDKVIFAGFIKNIHQEMRDCAMYVCSSDYEGISNSMLEAMGMGIPTVSTDCPIGGAREMITSGVNGILVPVGDSDALYAAMKQIITDSALAKRLSDAAYKIRGDYNISKIAQKWLDIM